MNPALRALGYSQGDRVVIVHADDVGMCGATVDAFFELADGGLVSSAAVMVPCPWFPVVAARCCDRDDLDVGVHVTLTSEWEGYRWGPIASRDPASGLVDDDGYFHRHQDAWGAIDRAAARAEMRAQLGRAVTAGIDVTHLDTHMCSVLHGSLTDGYARLGIAHRVPVLLAREGGWLARVPESRMKAWEDEGLAVVDHVRCMPLDGVAGDSLAAAKRCFDELPPGLTHLILHPAADTPELRAITPDWRHRVADYETFRDPDLARHVRRAGIEIVGWRPFRELMRSAGRTFRESA
jgi:chitin disaccharide deacetylase